MRYQKTSKPDFIPLAKALFIGVLAMSLATAQPALAAGKGKSSSGESPFVGQTQIAVTIMQSFRPSGIMQLDAGIYVDNPAQRARVAALRPVLRDAWRRTSQDFANTNFIAGRVPNAVLLSQRLQTATDQIIGANNGRVLMISLIVR
jgi:hypothetical protein